MSKKLKYLLFITVFSTVLIITVILQLVREESSQIHIEDQDNAISEQPEADQLARKYCSACHLFPDPDLLDRKTWETQTLPAMGPFVGIFEFEGEEYPVDITPGLSDDFYPDRAMITRQEWGKIVEYYTDNAPERLIPSGRNPEITREDLFFRAKRPVYRTDANPMASAVRFDTANKLIYLADATVERMLVYNRDLEIVASFEISSPVSDIRFTNDYTQPGVREMIITYIGNLDPSDLPDGLVARGWFDPETSEGNFSEIIIDNIARPVETISGDLNQNGYDDLLVSEFGHRNGSIFWLENSREGYYREKNTLIDTPGCIQSHILDYNSNGLPDIVALCSQVDQSIYLFENQGNGSFERKSLVDFHILSGSSSFELHDFNGNGHFDILYTSGDNADYSITYKPYHGVYIYMNDGDNNFEKKWFYPVNGAYNAKARDFNRNGLLDIAVISFFADYARIPQEGFVFFKNEGDFDFRPYHPQAASYGRWITMDVGDWTGNGVDDIVLANFSLGPTRVHPQVENIITQSPHLLVLENHFIEVMDDH